jgi:hypothetical protein
MPGPIQGSAIYPGVQSIKSGTYTGSHGIMPGQAVLMVNPQLNWSLVPNIGTLIITDGQNNLQLNNARLINARYKKDEEGEFVQLTFEDRRWVWRYGSISGRYNQRDEHNKLQPWTIQSPLQVMTLLLAAMGEFNAVIDMPAGLDSSWGQNINSLLNLGQNFPASGLNPPINWNGDIPALMAQQFAMSMGRTLFLDPATDTVYVLPIGQGGPLPDGGLSIKSLAPSISVSPAPSILRCRGSATRFQGRFKVRAVGLDWDQSWRAINDLSYAPIIPAQVLQHQILFNWNGTNNPGFRISGTYKAGENETRDFQFSSGVAPITTAQAASMFTSYVANSAANILGGINPAIGIDSRVSSLSFIVAGQTAGVILSGAGFDNDFNVQIKITSAGDTDPNIPWVSDWLLQRASTERRGWDYSEPPEFQTVQRVVNPLNPGGPPLLTEAQARQLAQQTVFKCYRVMQQDVSQVMPSPIIIPGYGKLKRREQILLQDEKTQQIQPQAGDLTFVDSITGEPYIQMMWNGYSRNQQAQCFGGVCLDLFGDMIGPNVSGGTDSNGDPTQIAFNTPSTSPIPIDFSVDPKWQIIKFGSPVYSQGEDGSIQEPINLILETACNILDQDTNEIVCFTSDLQIQAGDLVSEIHRPDVQLDVYGVYGGSDGMQLTETKLVDLDAVTRAQFYLQSWALQYQTFTADTREYNGVVPVQLDGAICQITVHFGGGGFVTTTVSMNTEHANWLMPASERRRAEFIGQGNLERMLQVQDTMSPARTRMFNPEQSQN